MAQTITLTALEIAPRYFTIGDTVTVTVTVKNNSTSQGIFTILPELTLERNIGTLSSALLVDWAWTSVTLAKGKTATFTISGICRDVPWEGHSTVTEIRDYMDDQGIRCMAGTNMGFYFTAKFDNFDGDGVTLSGAAMETLMGHDIGLLNRHLPGVVRRCTLKRCRLKDGTTYVLDDEGTTLRASVALTLGDGFAGSNVSTKQIVVTGDGGSGQTVSLTAAQLDTMLTSAGYAELGAGGLVGGTWSNGENLTARFEIGDAYELMVFTATVPRAFANLHLSGCTTGGVAFGKFSASAEGSPLFECTYPAIFTGGVDIGVDWQALTVESAVTTPATDGVGNGALRVGREGAHVYLRGGVELRSASTAVLIATLPSGCAPTAGEVHFAARCSGARVAGILIDTSGGLYLEWIYTFGSSSKYVGNVWVDLNLEFWRD